MQKLTELKEKHLAKVYDLLNAANVLEWDAETNMPDGGAQARAHQAATLRGLAHQLFTADEVGDLIETLQPELDNLDPDSNDAATIRLAKHYYDQQKAVPSELITRLQEASRMGAHIWAEARQENNFAKFQPKLQEIVDLTIEYAERLSGGEGNPYDALLDQYEPGIDAEQIETVFTPLKAELVDLVKAVSEAEKVDDSVLRRHYPHDDQLAFSREVVTELGYDFSRGRMDLAVHPFTINFSMDDVRITTRVWEDFLPACLMGSIHEAGHAMYEQGISPDLYRIAFYPDMLGQGASMSLHESQSRFYENILGRSRPFWQYFYPKAQEKFPHLKDTDLETFYRALNTVEPSFIRVEADEVTYGLHIMLRFEIENDLINRRIEVKDLPAIWNAKVEEYLGITPPDDTKGVLQDVHWSAGLLGYFPDYLLGSIFSVQLWEQMKAENPAVESGIANGEFAPVLTWLNKKIHQHGRKYTLPELSESVTGKPLTWQPYMDYLKAKASEVYNL